MCGPLGDGWRRSNMQRTPATTDQWRNDYESMMSWKASGQSWWWWAWQFSGILGVFFFFFLMILNLPIQFLPIMELDIANRKWVVRGFQVNSRLVCKDPSMSIVVKLYVLQSRSDVIFCCVNPLLCLDKRRSIKCLLLFQHRWLIISTVQKGACICSVDLT